MQDKIIGFTAGVFDMFHIGHLNLLKNAAARCDYLIVGVNSDELVQSYKDKKTVVPLAERVEIIRQIKYVNEVVVIDSLDKKQSWKKLHYDRLFIGDDWRNNPRWKQTEKEMAELGVKVVYLPHTNGTSSTLLRDRLGDDNWGMTMKVDKEYCMSSYLTVRYVYRKDKVFKEGLAHREHPAIPKEKKVPCFTARDIDSIIKRFLPPPEKNPRYFSAAAWTRRFSPLICLRERERIRLVA
ncbi:MAG: adenylyltransferase/cytidyltransferase family protein [Selenomonadaceae bacterium]|nr:adenylyltransferase/cytidyltransferase family protein [Selenomonadaceae bacterium]